MRDDYKLSGPTQKIQVELETHVCEQLEAMEEFTKLKSSELINTALKRFITQHKDFLPPGYSPRKKLN